jgi:hypothetical protein
VNAVVTVTDGDGDVATQSIAIGNAIQFQDDGPSPFDPSVMVTYNELGATSTKPLDIDGDLETGADGFGNIRFPATLNGDSGLTSGGLPITYTVSPDGRVLTAATIAGVVFVVTLTPDNVAASGDDTYTIQMFGTVDGGASAIDFNSDTYNFVGGNAPWAGFSSIEEDSRDLLLTPTGPSGQTINGNANEAGVSGQGAGGGGNEIGLNEGMRLDFVIDLIGDPNGAGGYQGNPLVTQDHTFDGHYDVNGVSFSLRAAASTTVFRLEAFDDPDLPAGDDSVVDLNRSRDSITAIGINFFGESVLVNADDGLVQVVEVGMPGGPPRTFTVTFIDMDPNPDPEKLYVAQISGGDPTDVEFAVYTADNFNSLEIYWVGGEQFSLGGFGTSTITPGVPVDFNLPVELVDGDGDVVTGTLDINLLPEDAPAPLEATVAGEYTATLAQPHIIGSDFDDTLNGEASANILYGGDGADTVNGNGGNDFLFGNDGEDLLFGGDGIDRLDGGTGYDELTGGAGADTFVLENLDVADLIVDYDGGQGDVIDLTALFDTGGADVADFVDYNAGTGTLSVDVDGTSNGVNFVDVATLTLPSPATHTITLLYDNGAGTQTTQADAV